MGFLMYAFFSVPNGRVNIIYFTLLHDNPKIFVSFLSGQNKLERNI